MVQILMEAGGDPNLPNSWNGRTALQYARAKKDTRHLDLLHPRWREEYMYLAGHSPSASMKKGVRRATPLAEQAERAGVVKRLRPLPELPEFASAEQTEAHKKDVYKIQVANRQIVSRAEAALEAKNPRWREEYLAGHSEVANPSSPSHSDL